MGNARRHVGVLALLIASLASGRAVDPDSALGQELDAPAPLPAESAPMQGGGISLQEAVRMALEQHPGGRVVRAVTVDDGRYRVHEVRILLPPDEGGRVVTVSIPAGNAR